MRKKPILRASASCVLALVISGAAIQAADTIRIVPLVRDGRVLLSFELADAFTNDVHDAIQSGLQTTFTYTVELRVEVPAWIDRTIASATIGNTVQYDNLTRRHTVVRTLDGRVEETHVTESEAEVRELLTTFRAWPVFSTSKLEPNRDYYVRVRTSVQPRNVAFVWPWTSGPSGMARFTFIP